VTSAAEKMMGSAYSGGWENCSVIAEHMSIANLFLNNFVKK
jgi:hypothetical protein